MSEEHRRSLEYDDEEEEELDEFGRVIRRRAKFKKAKPDEAIPDVDARPEPDKNRRDDRYSYRSRRHSRRSSRSISPSRSRSRSPRRHYHRYHSDSDDDYDHRHHISSSRYRGRGSSIGHRYHHRPYYPNGRGQADVYSEAAQYLDTEFYATKIYVGELVDVTESQLRSIFARFGPLESVRLVEGKDYGFVTYERKESALAAIQNMNGALVGSRHIKVNRAKIPERNKVGFGNVPWQDEDGLMAQEASYENYDSLRPPSSASLPSSAVPPPPNTTIPQRSLTTYDDL